jgi:GNAT superfamily N-acetyltransferase
MAIEVRELTPDEWPLAAAAVATRSLQDGPGMLFMLGDELLPRTSTLYAFTAERSPDASMAFGAFAGELLVGCARMARDGSCLGASAAAFGPIPEFTGEIPPTELRALCGMARIAASDPPWPHWHFAPVAVEPGFQGIGIGHMLMEPLLVRADGDDIPSFLETDKPVNVRFYESMGFVIDDYDTRWASESWNMSRPVGG